MHRQVWLAVLRLEAALTQQISAAHQQAHDYHHNATASLLGSTLTPQHPILLTVVLLGCTSSKLTAHMALRTQAAHTAYYALQHGRSKNQARRDNSTSETHANSAAK